MISIEYIIMQCKPLNSTDIMEIRKCYDYDQEMKTVHSQAV